MGCFSVHKFKVQTESACNSAVGKKNITDI